MPLYFHPSQFSCCTLRTCAWLLSLSFLLWLCGMGKEHELGKDMSRHTQPDLPALWWVSSPHWASVSSHVSWGWWLLFPVVLVIKWSSPWKSFCCKLDIKCEQQKKTQIRNPSLPSPFSHHFSASSLLYYAHSLARSLCPLPPEIMG